MRERLDYYNTRFDFWQQAGYWAIIRSIEDLKTNPYCFQIEALDRRSVEISWDGNFAESWSWLVRQTFQLDLERGVLFNPWTSNLLWGVSVVNTILDCPPTRPNDGGISLEYASNATGSLRIGSLKLKSIVQHGFPSRIESSFNKGRLVDVPGWLMPNSRAGMLQEGIDFALTSLFAPLSCPIFQGYDSKDRYIAVPIFKTTQPVFRYPSITDWYVGSDIDAAIAAIDILGVESLAGVKVYAYRKKQPNRPIKIQGITEVWIDDRTIEAVSLRKRFPNEFVNADGHPPFVSNNRLRPLILENCLNDRPLYYRLGDELDFRDLAKNKSAIQELFFPDSTKHQFEAEALKPVPILDPEDQPLFDRYLWRFRPSCGWFRRFREGGRHKTRYLHREILNLTLGQQDMQVRFVDNNKSNCRRDNLEIVTMSEKGKNGAAAQGKRVK